MRKFPLAAAAALSLLLPGLGIAQSANFPDHPVRFVVPFTAGGNADVVARIVAKGMSDALKQSVVVDNKPGANAMIGAEAVARAPADGYTLLEATAETHAINPHIYKKVPYDAIKDFAAVGVMDYFPFALVVNPKLPVNSLKEFVVYAKERPGKLSFASWGVGSTSQIAFEQFKQTAGLNMLHVPFQGAAPAITAVSSSQVDAFFVPLSVAVPQARSGHVKLLGTTTAGRAASSPEVPAFSEQGYPVVIGGWHVIVAPKATPKAVLARLNQALNEALKAKEIREALTNQGLDPANTTPAEADKMLQAEWQRWGKIAKDAAITVD